MRFASFLATIIAVLAAPLVSAEAQPLTDRHIEVIRRNCTQAQQILQVLQRNEAAARVNRGREYESTIRLLTALNSRVALNNINAPALAAATSDLDERFATFRTDYISYDAQLKSVLRLKCSEQPVTFYDQLTLAREARAKVAKDINDIDALLDQYQKALNDLRTSLKNEEATP